MAGISTSLTSIGLDEAIRKLKAVAGFDMANLADDAGALLESSTRQRFITKTAPSGQEWSPWSEDYAQTRGDHHSLLVGDSDDPLHLSIASYSDPDEVQVGSNLIHAAHQHFGGEETGSGITARPYLGLSDRDISDLNALAITYMDGPFQ